MAAVFDLPMKQGQQFDATFHWYAGGVFRGVVEDVLTGYPTRIKCTGHGLPAVSSTPVIIADARGIDQINSTELKIHMADRVDDDWFNLPVNTYGDEWEPGTGCITYHMPRDITSYTARAQLRRKWHDTNFIHEMTTENGGIVLRAADAQIQLLIPAATTATFTFSHCKYDVELVSPTGTPYRVFQGEMTLHREQTR